MKINLIFKWAKDLNKDFSKRYTNGNNFMKKMFGISSLQGIEVQSHNEIPLHTH